MRINRLLIAGIVSVGLLTSCASDEESGGGTGSPATIKLSLATNGATKASTLYPGSSDTGGTIGTNEGVVTNVSVGLFDDKGYKVTLDDYDYTNATANPGGSRTITTSTRAKQIIVVANVPLTGLFATANNETDFLAMPGAQAKLEYTTDIKGQSDANKNTANSQQIKGLPMCVIDNANASLATLGSSTTSSANPIVALKRVVARISLMKLITLFAGTPYQGASFIPQEVFMYNVNDRYQWNGTASASVSLVTGESTDRTIPTVTPSLTNFSYLSSGAITTMSATGDQTYLDATKATNPDNPYFFYVFPHNATLPTKLVVKGIFTLGGTSEVMYYPIVVNRFLDATSTSFTGDGLTSGKPTNDSQLSQNTCYGISLTIKGRGVDDPSKDIVPASVTLKMTVNVWSTSSEDITVQ